MKKYNKLVRDDIPQKIVKSGKSFKIRILDDKEYILELKRKLVEESKELLKSYTIEETLEELADVVEVLDYLRRQLNITNESIKEQRDLKKKKNGSFEERIFLEYVE